MGDKNEDPVELKINCRTWLKDTEDLFDFETSNINTNIYTYSNLEKEFFIIKYKDNSDEKQKEKINFIHSNLIKQKINANNTTKIAGVLKYNKIKNNIQIINSFKSRLINNLYMPENCERLYKLFPKDTYININEGDIIKIGRIRMKFDKISFKSKDKSLPELIYNNLCNDSQIINSKENTDKNLATSVRNITSGRDTTEINSKPYCKLCYQTESVVTDPLISPCNCSGTMKYIHLSCLKSSIKIKYHKKSEKYYDMFVFQNYNCEICLTNYPKYIIYKKQVYFLIDIDFDKFENYALCDLTQYIDNNQRITHFGYLMIKIEDDTELSLGRKKNNNIKLKDISVSRNHCILKKIDNNLFMKDLGSKFGTMKYINNYLDINFNENTKLLTGKHELEFALVKSWNFFGLSNIFKMSCCSCNQNNGDQAELIMFNEENYDKNSDNKLNSDDLKNSSLKKYNYYNKFKDSDSYNDYIIKIDNIIGIDNYGPDCKDNKDNENGEEEEGEIITNQMKEKEESFTNYY